MTTTLALLNANSAPLNVVPRKDVKIGQMFTNKGGNGNVYGHIGARTDPPSNNSSGKIYGKSTGGRDIFGFQSVLLAGKAKDDGLTVTFDGDKQVTIVGNFHVATDQF